MASVSLRSELPFHKHTSEESTLNTLRYLFFHMRCGIFVMIRHRRVVMFVPFVNKDYTNTWAQYMTFEHGSLQEYSHAKAVPYLPPPPPLNHVAAVAVAIP